MESKFNFEDFKKEAVGDLLSGKSLSGPDGVLAPLIKQFLEAALEAELESHIKETKASGVKNRRNGRMSKEVRSLSGGNFSLETPRDREGSFEPQMVQKRQVFIGADLERKVIKLYARGMSYEDISAELREIYGIEASAAFLSEVTDKVVPLMESWRNRELEKVYYFTFLDAMHFRVRGENSRVGNVMLYLVMGITKEGKKDVLGMYLAETEGAKFWLHVLQDLRRRGVEDLLIVSVDGLKGFEEAIRTFYPEAEVQQCVVHQIRHTMKFVSDKDGRDFIKDLKLVYQAGNLESAERGLNDLETKWGKKYPAAIESWRLNWGRLSTYLQYPEAIRRIIYTTNPIESLNRRIRKVTKTKGAFVSETALFKVVYLVIQEVTDKWVMKQRDWGQILGQMQILFGERARIFEKN